MKMYKGVEVELHTFLTSALDKDMFSFMLQSLYSHYPLDREDGLAPELVLMW
jgi:hypothetical protein